jgi:Pyruvate/2-oxoacid:ferredoxin oxidoreductase delta subunit
MRLIDGDELLKKLVFNPSDMFTDRIREIVKEAPTVDANVVIRCKDCYHFEPFDCPDGWGICRLNGNSDWKGSDHCSYGCE